MRCRPYSKLLEQPLQKFYNKKGSVVASEWEGHRSHLSSNWCWLCGLFSFLCLWDLPFLPVGCFFLLASHHLVIKIPFSDLVHKKLAPLLCQKIPFGLVSNCVFLCALLPAAEALAVVFLPLGNWHAFGLFPMFTSLLPQPSYAFLINSWFASLPPLPPPAPAVSFFWFIWRSLVF